MAYLIWSFVLDTLSSDWIQILNKTCNTSVLLLDLPGQHVVLRPLVGRNLLVFELLSQCMPMEKRWTSAGRKLPP
jgi:hypothetical protein